MKRLLSIENKENIRRLYADNPVFCTIEETFIGCQQEMHDLRFSCEEIFVNCFNEFDNIVQHTDSCKPQLLWQRLRNSIDEHLAQEGRTFDSRQLDTVTSYIAYCVVMCLVSSGDPRLHDLATELMTSIAQKGDCTKISRMLMSHLHDGFAQYIQHYVEKKTFISQLIDNPKAKTDPDSPLIKPADRTKMLDRARQRLKFMQGAAKQGDERSIMTPADHNTMMEAVEFLINNNTVKKQERKLRPRLPVATLRYSFYQIWKEDKHIVERQQWVEFLKETFQQFEDTSLDTIAKKFSEKPQG